jgi:hypothetical protein
MLLWRLSFWQMSFWQMLLWQMSLCKMFWRHSAAVANLLIKIAPFYCNIIANKVLQKIIKNVFLKFGSTCLNIFFPFFSQKNDKKANKLSPKFTKIINWLFLAQFLKTFMGVAYNCTTISWPVLTNIAMKHIIYNMDRSFHYAKSYILI